LFADNAIELSQVFDLDTELLKVTGIKMGHNMKIMKLINSYKHHDIKPQIDS